MPDHDHYQTLGVSRTATAQEIRAAYRTMVKKTHPDVNPTGSSSELFIKVQTAYDTLSRHTKNAANSFLLVEDAIFYCWQITKKFATITFV